MKSLRRRLSVRFGAPASNNWHGHGDRRLCGLAEQGAPPPHRPDRPPSDPQRAARGHPVEIRYSGRPQSVHGRRRSVGVRRSSVVPRRRLPEARAGAVEQLPAADSGAGFLSKAELVHLASPFAARAHREAGNRGFKARCQGVQRRMGRSGSPVEGAYNLPANRTLQLQCFVLISVLF